MSVTYTNRKGQTYTLYKGETKSGKPRYYFSRTGQGQGEPVTEIPPGFTISESVNGIVSLAKDRPPLIQPEELAVVEEVMKQLPDAHLYQASIKQNMIEIYERVGPSYDVVISELQKSIGWIDPNAVEQFRAKEESRAQYAPVLRFTLLDSTQRLFGVKRMCYRGSIDGWLELMRPESPLATLAQEVIPTLGTDDFFELW